MSFKEIGMSSLGFLVCAVVVVFGVLVACSVVPASPPAVGLLIAAAAICSRLK